MPTLDELSAKVRNFYANVDPNKSQAEMDEVTFIAYSKGEDHVNANLRAKYGMDLNTFPVSTAPGGAPGVVVAQAAPGYYPAAAQGVVLATPANGGVVTAIPVNGGPGAPKVIYVQQAPGTTPFATSQTYQYNQYVQDRRADDTCCAICLGVIAAMLCLDCLVY